MASSTAMSQILLRLFLNNFEQDIKVCSISNIDSDHVEHINPAMLICDFHIPRYKVDVLSLYKDLNFADIQVIQTSC